MTDVPPDQSIKNNIDAFVLEKGSQYEWVIRPMLDELSIRILVGLDADGYEVRKKTK